MNKLKNHKFEKYETYQKIPIISYEHAFHSFINNPYINMKSNGNFVILQTDIYEAWEENESKAKITNEKEIDEIIKDSKIFVKKNDFKLKKLLETKVETSEKALELLKQLNNLSRELYYTYSCFTVELIHTENKKLLKILPETRMELSNFVDKIWKIYDKILDFIVEYESTTRKKLDSLISSEIEDILKGKNDLLKQDLEERAFAMTIIDNKIETHIGKEAEKIKTELYKQKEETLLEKKELQGMPACKGKAKGKVVLLKERDYKKFSEILSNRKDFVLVTFMTRPEIVPFLKKARAIVTNEGGITCHAAIISRELNIPCIVGTKKATDILKDGDEVEVDANTGIVRVVK